MYLGRVRHIPAPPASRGVVLFRQPHLRWRSSADKCTRSARNLPRLHRTSEIADSRVQIENSSGEDSKEYWKENAAPTEAAVLPRTHSKHSAQSDRTRSLFSHCGIVGGRPCYCGNGGNRFR